MSVSSSVDDTPLIHRTSRDEASTAATVTGVNPAAMPGTHIPSNILVGGRQWEYLPNIITYFRI